MIKLKKNVRLGVSTTVKKKKKKVKKKKGILDKLLNVLF